MIFKFFDCKERLGFRDQRTPIAVPEGVQHIILWQIESDIAMLP